MKQTLSIQEALHKVAAICSSREQCSWDISNKLIQWNIQEKDRETIIERLIEEKFLDDNRFCRGYVNDKFRFNKWGRIKIRYQLRQKQIKDDLIEKALAQIDESSYLSTLTNLLSEKRKQLKGETDFNKNGKLFRFAVSRGFEPEYILKIINADVF